MTLNTLVEYQQKNQIAKIEIHLLPGLPQVHFLGLADQTIKESFLRIKSAFKSCGYQFPKAHQVIVNIEPQNIKKSSRGLELAVALGLLHLTQQKLLTQYEIENGLFAGELSLDGSVKFTSDLLTLPREQIEKYTVVSGENTKGLHILKSIRDEIQYCQKQECNIEFERPQLGLKSFFTKDEAEFIFLMATSGLHALLAGQPGVGKSYLAKNYSAFLPEKKNILENLNYKQSSQMEMCLWYPVIAPHHSVTPGAFLGGGSRLLPGEIEKVEHGVLILDELLEFDKEILEALREPMTGQVLRLARAEKVKMIQPSFQVVATSNLCPCGQWLPDEENYHCRYSVSRCKGYLQKLSGPLLDRFGLLMYFKAEDSEIRNIQGKIILNRIEKFFVEYQTSNEFNLKSEDLNLLLNSFYKKKSLRRVEALLKIAEVYAREEGRSEINLQDLQKSEKWTIKTFEMLN